jgi:hypothetical protein
MISPTALAKWLRKAFADTEFSTAEALEKLRASGLVTKEEADELEIGRHGLLSGKRKLDHTLHNALQIAKRKGWIKRAGQYGRWFALRIESNPTQATGGELQQVKADKLAQAKVLLHQVIDLLLE